MNHGSSPSAVDDVPASEAPVQEDEPSATLSEEHNHAAGLIVPPQDQDESKKLQLEALKSFLVDLQAVVDTLVYMELSALYYMDISALRFFLRGLIQFTYLTPKPAHLPVPKTTFRLGSIVSVNMLCILLHIFSKRAEASETTRGYLHGSIIIDFIGQRSPASLLHLLLLDILVLLLQLLGLALFVRFKAGELVLPASQSGNMGLSGLDLTARQDVDSEERGLLRHEIEETFGEGIELQSMGSFEEDRESLLEPGGRSDEYGQRLFSVETEDSAHRPHPLEVYQSGQVIVADFRFLGILKDEYLEFRRAVRNDAGND